MGAPGCAGGEEAQSVLSRWGGRSSVAGAPSGDVPVGVCLGVPGPPVLRHGPGRPIILYNIIILYYVI